jgi:hypothetical protein
MLAGCRVVKKVKGAGPSQGTQDESPWDSRDGPGATKTGVARILDFAGAGEITSGVETPSGSIANGTAKAVP